MEGRGRRRRRRKKKEERRKKKEELSCLCKVLRTCSTVVRWITHLWLGGVGVGFRWKGVHYNK